MPGVDQDTTGGLASASSNNWARGGLLGVTTWWLDTGNMDMHLRCRVGGAT